MSITSPSPRKENYYAKELFITNAADIDYVCGISNPHAASNFFFSILKCSIGDRCETISSLIPLQQCNHSLDCTSVCGYRPNKHDL